MKALTTSQENLLRLIEMEVQNASYNAIHSRLAYNNQVTMNDLSYAIQSAITQSISAAFEKYLSAQYTHTDFENDLGLKD